ncbi:hypothetical protein KGP36_06905 [Patescibacteria group bacterium]|nr:hypothetical protein [Patescibacteria group bacterium]
MIPTNKEIFAESVFDVLTSLRNDVKSGKMIGIAVAFVMDDDTIGQEFGFIREGHFQLVAAIDVLHRQVLDGVLNGPDDTD